MVRRESHKLKYNKIDGASKFHRHTLRVLGSAKRVEPRGQADRFKRGKRQTIRPSNFVRGVLFVKFFGKEREKKGKRTKRNPVIRAAQHGAATPTVKANKHGTYQAGE